MTSATREQKKQLYAQLIGQTLAGKYRITGLMGFGGMGAVYEAVQSPMERKVALKVIPTYDSTAATRFEREAATVGKLSHPNTVKVFDFGQTQEHQLYLAMEHLTGQTLTELISAQAPLAPDVVVKIGEQICRSLAEAHRQGIIHRDIKPDNIFLITVDGDPNYVKVLDFGIAKAIQGEEDDPGLTAEGRIVGTPRYMSPEQILAQPIDHRSDIYALGCILFEMITGMPPFNDQSTAGLMMSHAQQAPPSFHERLTPQQLEQLPAGLEAVVRRTIAKTPEARQQTTEQLRRELEQALRINQAYTSDISQPLTKALPDFTSPPPQHQSPPVTIPTGSQTGGFDRHTGDFAPNTGEQVAPAPEDRSKSVALLAGIFALLGILLAGGVYVYIEQSKQAEQMTATGETEGTPPEVVTAVEFDTLPTQGVKVFDITEGEQDPEFLYTPPRAEPLAIDPEGGRQRFMFTKEGYYPEILTIDLNGAEPVYSISLRKVMGNEAPSAKARDEGADDDAAARERTERRPKKRRPKKRSIPKRRDAPDKAASIEDSPEADARGEGIDLFEEDPFASEGDEPEQAQQQEDTSKTPAVTRLDEQGTSGSSSDSKTPDTKSNPNILRLED